LVTVEVFIKGEVLHPLIEDTGRSSSGDRLPFDNHIQGTLEKGAVFSGGCLTIEKLAEQRQTGYEFSGVS
jgi:hypothetical protein